jgi:predicted DNA-binding transcriptional regulator AlpA
MKTKPKDGIKGDGGRRKLPPVPLPPANSCEALMTKADVCAALRISLRALDGMISAGDYPAHDTKLGPQQPRWRRATHDAWIVARCAPAAG